MTFVPAQTAADAFSKDVAQTAHGLAVGDWIKVSGANSYAKAQANSAANAEVVGVVSEVTDANNFVYVFGGDLATSGLTVGSSYFLSPDTAGAMTAVAPSALSHVSKPVGVALSTTRLLVTPQERGAIIGSPLSQILNLGNFPASGAIGAAADTVDLYDAFTVVQTTGTNVRVLTVALTIPNPTVSTPGRRITFTNTGSVRARVGGIDLLPTSQGAGSTHSFTWTGTAWIGDAITAAQGSLMSAAAAVGTTTQTVWAFPGTPTVGRAGDWTHASGVITFHKPGVYDVVAQIVAATGFPLGTISWVEGGPWEDVAKTGASSSLVADPARTVHFNGRVTPAGAGTTTLLLDFTSAGTQPNTADTVIVIRQVG